MKKLLSTFVFASLFAITSTAQYDIEVNLVSPASGSSAGVGANFTVSYSITNNGPNEVPAGDSLYLALIHSASNYSLVNGQAGSVSVIVLPEALPSGETLVSSVEQINAVANLTGVTGEVCIFVTVGSAGFTTIDGDPNDTDMDNNVDCFMATAPSASVSELEAGRALAYPNPATDFLNILVESDDVVAVTIISVEGKVISSFEGSVAQVADLTSGVYFYEARTSSGAVIRNTFVKN